MTETTGLTPMIATPDPAAAIDFYERVFGAERLPLTLSAPDGAILHAEIRLGGAVVMLGQAGGPAPTDDPMAGPKLNLMVADADAAVARAVEAGATVLIPVADQFYGHRAGRIRDPFGYVWVISEERERLTPDAMQARLDALMRGA